jgi:hypothetical protein
MLIVSVVLGLIPLAGVIWVLVSGTLTTVDGLFTSLILLDLVRNIVFKRFPGASRPRPTQEKGRAPDATEAELEIDSSRLLHPT